MRFLDLWSWDGRIDRKTYTIVGLFGFAVKRIADALIVGHFWQRHLGFFNYWAPLGQGAQLDKASESEKTFLATMLMVAAPFIWIGVSMTLRRLRDAGLPVWLVIFFFIPFLNVPFFLALCLWPPHDREQIQQAAPWPRVRSLSGIIPRSELGGAVLSTVLTSVMGLVFVLLGTKVLGSYGWSLFVALPFCLGLFSVLFYSYHAPRTLGTCFSVSVLPVGVLAVILLAVAVEGIICLIMAAPLALGLAALGGWIGYLIQANYWHAKNPAAIFSIVLLFMPASFGVEHMFNPEPETFAARTAITIDARPADVWQKVIAFAEIPQPTEMLFRAGIAYPLRAEISGRGPGAVRHCIFSTGAFVEPIQIWDEPRLLKFGVTSNPPPLNELTPYGHIEARHLHGYFVSEEGQFLLTALPDGGTRLESTTWYRHTMWPAGYWRLWSDYVIHRIHLRVLNHIGEEAMKSGAGGGG